MKNLIKMKHFIIVLKLGMSLSLFGQESGAGEGQLYRSPARFEKAIQEFEAADAALPPPQGAIVCFGSSSIRKWETLQEDLAPLTVVPRGFGGSNMNDALHFADRIVLPCKPRAVVLYEGDNDIAQGVGSADIVDTFRRLIDKLHGQLPDCRVYVISIKPSIKRWNLWPQMQEANRLLAMECEKDPRLMYVDVASGMLDAAGQPKKIFVKDDLHMTPEGYVIWTSILKPILMKSELQYEAR